MKPNGILKQSVDVVMYILFLLLMGQCVLMTVHLGLHWSIYRCRKESFRER